MQRNTRVLLVLSVMSVIAVDRV